LHVEIQMSNFICEIGGLGGDLSQSVTTILEDFSRSSNCLGDDICTVFDILTVSGEEDVGGEVLDLCAIDFTSKVQWNLPSHSGRPPAAVSTNSHTASTFLHSF
jgi:hypothetical protein